MKKSIKIFATLSVLALASLTIGCEKWIEPEALVYERSLTESSHGDENSVYYRNLRAYKAKKDHTICFGWFSDWTGVGANAGGKLMGMPDSIDFVSMWGNWHSLSDEKKEDLRRVQTIKGTRVMMCFIIQNIGEQTTPQSVRHDWIVDGVQYNSEAEALRAFWGWYHRVSYNEAPASPEDSVAMENAIRKYAHSLLDTIDKYHWDGFDFDLEPNYGHAGNIASHPYRLNILIDELSKYLGPASGTNKLLCVDGEPYYLSAETAPKVDYYLLQAYGDGSDQSIDSRVSRLINSFADAMTPEEVVERTVLTSNFESWASTGGTSSGSYTSRLLGRVPQIVGFAGYRYPNVNARIGGFGAFRFGFDYSNGNNYGYVRQAIQVANPAVEIEE